MICGFTILHIIRCVVCHFGLSCFVGWLAYLLTSTILSHTIGSQTSAEGSSIRRFSLAVALCFAVLAHILEDYMLGWF